MNTANATPPSTLGPKHELWDHQEDAVRDVTAELRVADRAQFISACGTGKTITTQAICEALRAERILVFVPSISLIDQTLDPWAEQYEGRWQAVVVCSDQTVGRGDRRRSKSQGDSEDIITDAQLRAHGATVVRDVDELARIVQTHDATIGTLVVFSTYQSSEKVAQMQAATGVTFDIAIADEAHRIAVKDRASASARAGKLVLDAGAILAHKRVFATATPRVYKTKSKDAYRTTSEASMDNEDLFGRVAHTMSLREAIRTHLLAEYRIHIMAITTDELNVDIDADDDDVRLDLGVIARIRAEDELGATRVIAYLRDRHRARLYVKRAADAGIPNVDFITGDLTAEQRKPKLAMLEAGGTIANVRCLSEGVDIPALDAVIFVDPRGSKIDIVQAVGRVIRRAKGKDLGHVILPVLIDPGTPEQGWLEGNGFQAVWEVLAQMAANDTVLATYLTALADARDTAVDEHPEGGTSSDTTAIDDLEFPHDPNSPLAGPSLIEVHFPQRLGVDSSRLAELLRAKIELRAADLNDLVGGGFRRNAAGVGKFYLDEGFWPRQDAGDLVERALGQFLKSTRGQFNRGVLSDERVAYFDTVAAGWRDQRGRGRPTGTVSTMSRDAKWTHMADKLIAYVAKHGKFPRMSKSDPEVNSLAKWHQNQRTGRVRGYQWFTAERGDYLDTNLAGWDQR